MEQRLHGTIFDIKKFAIHDGPGIRTTVFMKGCPLECWWCHNPEAIVPGLELVWFENRCIGCKACIEACTEDALELTADDERLLHRDRCTLCGDCVDVCYAKALVLEGRQATVEEVMVELRKDTAFYERSGGGITLSGGEPTFQHAFALALLEQCQREGIHTALDTTGQTTWPILEKLVACTDLVLYDLKHIDPVRHRELTGVDNGRILANLAALGTKAVPVEVRMPIIPGVNDDRESICRAARFLETIDGLTRIVLLPFHKLGEAKYSRLSREAYKLTSVSPPDAATMARVAAWIEPYGMTVDVG